MPKVYEIGIRGTADKVDMRNYAANAVSPTNRPDPNLRAPRSQQEEEAELQRAINASLEESRRHLESKGLLNDNNGADLLDFGGPAPAARTLSSDVMSYSSAPTQPYTNYQLPQQPTTYGSPPVAAPYAALPSPQAGYYAPPPPQQQSPPYQQQQTGYYQAPPVDTYGASTSPQGDNDPFAPKAPTRYDIANDILSAYGTAAPTPTSVTSGQGWNTPISQPQQAWGQQPSTSPPQQNGQASRPALTMGALAQTEEESEQDPYTAALNKLVNVDHIDQPAEKQLKEAMKKLQEEKSGKGTVKGGKSRGKPPVANNMVGNAATLAQIESIKQKKEPTKEVMRPPPQLFNPDAAMAGALVVHGAPMMGAPPLQAQGFGVAYQQQQQQQAYGGYHSPQGYYPAQRGYQYR